MMMGPNDPAELPDEEDEIGEPETETAADETPGDEGQPEGDDPAGEGEGEPEGEELERQRPLSRSERRFQKLANETREAKEEAANAKRRLDEIERQRNIPNAEEMRRRELVEEEEARLAGPEAFADLKIRRSEGRIAAQLNGMAFRQADIDDKASFRELAADHPAIKAIAAEVEETLAQYRRNGNNPTREAVAKYLLGDRLLKRAPAQQRRQVKDGQRRVAAQTTRRGTGGGGDVRRDGRPAADSLKAIEARLKGQNI